MNFLLRDSFKAPSDQMYNSQRVQAPVLRVVFDTNFAVAILVFGDPPAEGVAARLGSAASSQAVADLETLAEFDRVLRYPEPEASTNSRRRLRRASTTARVAT
jgi:hypothetical protein